MFKSNEVFSNHHIFENGNHAGWIDVTSLMLTLRSLNEVKYHEDYCIENTSLKDDELKKATLDYYEKYGVCNKPVVITTENFCLDGRHRIYFNLLNNIQHIPAYVIPHERINTFIHIS